MAGQAPDETAAKILSAASRVLADSGSRRTTVELVAKSAGVSHMTIYRRWPSKTELLRTAVVTEFAGLVAAAFDAAVRPGRGFDAVVADAFAELVCTMRANPVMVQALATEPDLFLAGAGPDAYSMMSEAVPLIAEQLHRAADNTLTVPAATTLADAFLRLAHSLLLVDYPEQTLDAPADIAAYAAQTIQPLARSMAGFTAADPALDDEPASADDAAVIPLQSHRTRGNRSKVTLVAASLAAVMLGSAGVTAALVGPSAPTISPADLSQTQKPAVSVAPLPSLVPAPPVLPRAADLSTATATPGLQTPVVEREPTPAPVTNIDTDDDDQPTIGDRDSSSDDDGPTMRRPPPGFPPPPGGLRPGGPRPPGLPGPGGISGPPPVGSAPAGPARPHAGPPPASAP